MLKSKDYLFVGIQLVIFLAFLWSGPDWLRFSVPAFFTPIIFFLMGLGFIIMLLAIVQLRTNLSPFPTPKVSGELITHGIFKYIRHPIYSGILIFGIAWALVSGSYFRILLSILLLLLFIFKSNYEEEMLLEKFADYSEYKSRVGRFFPGL